MNYRNISTVVVFSVVFCGGGVTAVAAAVAVVLSVVAVVVVLAIVAAVVLSIRVEAAVVLLVVVVVSLAAVVVELSLIGSGISRGNIGRYGCSGSCVGCRSTSSVAAVVLVSWW